MADLFIMFTEQALMTVGVIFLFGYLIYLCNKYFYANLGSNAQAACYITGFVGTPVHECAHALFCLIFGHKIKEIKLFQIHSSDGTLGYVNHSFNPKNIYHKIGNFFIGIAPIIVIGGLLYLLSYLLVPSLTKAILLKSKRINLLGGVGALLEDFWGLCTVNFSFADDFLWWIFIFVGAFFALHMTLSSADIKGALSGLGLLLVVLFATDLVLFFIGVKYLRSFTSSISVFGGYMVGFLSLSLVISVLALGFSFIFKFGLSKLRKR